MPTIVPGSVRFLASELPPGTPDTALFHLLPVPLEASVSYGTGTACGPYAILNASDQLELWDGQSIPADLGIYTWPAVDCTGNIQAVLERIETAVARILYYGGLPVLLGGEHTLSYAALEALVQKGSVGVVQIDAHADLRDSYEGSSWSHACVMRRVVQNLGLPLAQFGVRALCCEEVAVRQEYGVQYFDAADIAFTGLPEQPLPAGFPDMIYLTFDVDGLDPSIMPATGTPVPGGLGWYTALRLLGNVIRGRRVLGMDVVELAPIPGLHMADFTAARLVYGLMGLVQRSGAHPQPASTQQGASR